MAPNEHEGICRLAEEWSVELEAEGAARLERFCALLLEWNKRVNLTGARGFDDLLAEHLPDSFVAARLIPPEASVVDIGSGGGLPSIPLAILRADCRLMLVEPRGKRVAFLNTAVRTCGCRNASVVQGRSEDLVSDGHDLAMSRATFAPGDWLELGTALVGPGARVLVFSTAEVSSKAMRLESGVSYRVGQGSPRWAGVFVRP
jgi:16S rRNA (guanine527-N7)-methyltransferase